MNEISSNNEKNWQEIIKVLKNSRRTAILWITCNDYYYRKELFERFKKEFSEYEHFTVSLKFFHHQNLQAFFEEQLPKEFFKNNGIKAIIHLTEIESQLAWHRKKKDKTGFFDVLNFEREIIFNKFPFHFVFWSEVYAQIEAQRYAPDFYDWITYKFEFQAPQNYQFQTREIIIDDQSKTKKVFNENEVYNRIARYKHLLEQLDENQTTDKITLLKNIISDYNKIGDYPKAKQAVEEALKIKDIKKSDKADLLNLAGMIYARLNDFKNSEKYFKEALQIYRELAKENPRTYLPDVAGTLNNLANLHYSKNEFSEALEKYNEALQIYRELAKENPRTFLLDVAGTLNNLANLHSDRNEFSEALEKYNETLQIRRELAKENPTRYLPGMAVTLNNLVTLQKVKNKFAEALDNYKEDLETIRSSVKFNTAFLPLPYMVKTLRNSEILQKSKKEFDQVIDIYKEILQILKKNLEENPRTYLPDVAIILYTLAGLYYSKNEFNIAKEKYTEALKIYRELAEVNAKTYLPDIALTLINLAIINNKMQNNKEAVEMALEALEIAKKFEFRGDMLKVISKANSILAKEFYPKIITLYEENKADITEEEYIKGLINCGASYSNKTKDVMIEAALDCFNKANEILEKNTEKYLDLYLKNNYYLMREYQKQAFIKGWWNRITSKKYIREILNIYDKVTAKIKDKTTDSPWLEKIEEIYKIYSPYRKYQKK